MDLANLPDPITRNDVMRVLDIGETLLRKYEVAGKISFDRNPFSGRKTIPIARFEKQLNALTEELCADNAQRAIRKIHATGAQALTKNGTLVPVAPGDQLLRKSKS